MIKSPKPIPHAQVPGTGTSGLIRRGTVWWIDLHLDGRRIRRSTRTSDENLARMQVERLRQELLVGRITGTTPECLRPKVDLVSHIERVLNDLKAEGLRPSTLRRYGPVWRNFAAWLNKELGRKPMVHDITPSVMVRWREHAERSPRSGNGRIGLHSRPPSPRTVANELDILRAFLRRCVRAGLLNSNPEEGIGRPRDAYQHHVRALGQDETERLLGAADSYDTWRATRGCSYGPILGLVMRLYLHTGLRLEELRQITLDDATARDSSGLRILRLRPRSTPLTVLVPHAPLTPRGRRKRAPWPEEINAMPDCPRVHHRREGVIQFTMSHHWRPKTKGRDVPLSPTACTLVEEIRTWRECLLASKHPLCRARRDLELPEPPFLIPDPCGLAWRWQMSRIMQHCCEHVGISPVVRTHDLRHTFATRLRAMGVQLETIKDLLGHADIAETMCYAHYNNREGLTAVSLLG